MSDDLTPDDPFEQRLTERLRSTADPIDGDGVTRAGVAAAVVADRRRHQRTRGLLVTAAAVVAVLGGLAAVARSGDDGNERVIAAETTTTLAPCADLPPVPADPFARWFRLTSAQAEALADAGLIVDDRAGEPDHGTLVGVEGLQLLGGLQLGPIQEQQEQMLVFDPDALHFLRSEDLVTDAQEAAIAGGTVPPLTQEQVDLLLARFPDLLAVPRSGDLLIYGSDPSTTGDPATTTTTWAEGETPFDQWADHLRTLGLLSAEQEAEIAAGRGISLTPEQSAAMQDYWDQQAAATSTTALSFAPGDASTTSDVGDTTTTAPCRPATTIAVPVTTTEAGATTTTSDATTTLATTTTSSPATTTTTATTTTSAGTSTTT